MANSGVSLCVVEEANAALEAAVPDLVGSFSHTVLRSTDFRLLKMSCGATKLHHINPKTTSDTQV